MAADKELRRARDRFGSLKTQLALNEAIADVSGVTPFDTERIIAQLGEHLCEFKHINGFKECRVAFVAWAARQARLIVQLRTILSELDIADNIATLVLLRLPEYRGVEGYDAQKSWTVETANREALHLSSLADLVTKHRAAVRRGIRRALATCGGLGLDSRIGPVDGEITSYLHDDGPWSMTVDEIESDVWIEVATDLEPVVMAERPGALLYEKAYWAGRTWKSNRLRERKELSDKFSIGTDGIEKVVTNGNGETERSDASQGFIDLYSFHNPIIIHELPWTEANLERELRRAGPFRADGFDVIEPLSVAA